MHYQAKHFMDWVKSILPSYFINKKVIDIGGGDINGNNRYLFEDCEYDANDVCEANNVTIVSKTSQLPFSNSIFDTIISTECFEHDPEYALSIKKIYDMLKPNGLFAFTCASVGRGEHGTRRTTPFDSYASNVAEMQDYYKNLIKEDVIEIFENKMDNYFSGWDFYFNPVTCDLYFLGIKKNNDNFKINFTTYVM